MIFYLVSLLPISPFPLQIIDKNSEKDRPLQFPVHRLILSDLWITTSITTVNSSS